MTLPLFKEKRLSNRLRLSGLLPGKLISKKDGKALNARAIDVSVHGLGVLISEEILPGTMLELVLPNQKIELRIAWRQPDFGKRDLFRYGLVSENLDIDLQKIFADANCLK